MNLKISSLEAYMLKSVKFGGSSLASSVQFKKVKDIILADKDRKYIICSAAGKANSDDHKITDLLYLCCAHKKYGVEIDDIFKMIEDKFKEIITNLNIDINLKEELDLIKLEFHKEIDTDYIVSRGEYLTSKIMASYLDVPFIDAKDIIYFNYDGSYNEEKIKQALISKTNNYNRVVIPGFYGSLPNGQIKLMDRGGSDITGALIALYAGCKEYENFTDVSGIMVADPRIIKNPKVIKAITYNELREMSYMGAKVIHDEAILPLKYANIPIHILNTFKPDEPGTLILENCKDFDAKEKPLPITGITGRQNFSVINITKNHISSEVGILKKALEIIESYKLSVESVPTGIDSFSIVLDTVKSKNIIYQLMADLKKELNLDSIELTNGISLVAVVSRAMKSKKGFSGKLFALLGENNINIRLISQTIDEINIIVGVNNEDFDNTIKCIYNKFIGE